MPAAAAPDVQALDSLPPPLRALAERGVLRRYRKGTLLIQEGDQGDTLYLIVSGRLRAFAVGERDREITYGVYGPGEYLGEMSLDGGPRSASVETLEASSCVVITRQTLLAHIAEHPEFALELLAKVIRRARAATLTARQMALNDVYGRLRLLIDELAGPPDADGTRALLTPVTHQQMAQRLGCSREMVSRLMKDLERGGYLRLRGRQVLLQSALPARW